MRMKAMLLNTYIMLGVRRGFIANEQGQLYEYTPEGKKYILWGN